MRVKTKHAAVALGAAALLGCASEVQPELTAEQLGVLAPAEGLPTVCGQIHYEDDGKVSTRDEWYSFSTMNRLLDADEALRHEAGLSRVEDCDQARTFSRAHTRYMEGPNAPESADFDESPQTTVLERAGDGAEDKIKNGRTQPWASVVRFNDSCTGTLLSGRVMITAAHCIPHEHLIYDTDGNGSADSGSMDFYVHYDRIADGFGNPPLYCLTASGAAGENRGACGPNEFRTMSVRVHPDYFGSSKTGPDVALVIAPADWNGASQSAHWRRINSGGLALGHDFRAFGAGSNANGGLVVLDDEGDWVQQGLGAGVTRDQEIANIDYLGDYHFYHNGDHLRMCKGDSGGPAIDTRANSLVGVHSNVDYPDSYGSMANPYPACAGANEHMRWARVSDKITWINNILRIYLRPQCTRPTTISGVTYRECW